MNPQSWKLPVVALILSALAAVTWWKMTPSPANVGDTTVAKEDKRIEETPTETIQPKKGVETLVPAAKGVLNLPKDIQANPKKHVTGSVIVKPDPRPQAVIPVFDEDTGKTVIETQRMEYPLVALERRGEVRISYGFKTAALKAGRIAGRYDVLQIKGGNVGIGASLDTDGSHLVDIGIAWQF